MYVELIKKLIFVRELMKIVSEDNLLHMYYSNFDDF